MGLRFGLCVGEPAGKEFAEGFSQGIRGDYVRWCRECSVAGVERLAVKVGNFGKGEGEVTLSV